jgi:aspartate racemase
MDAIYGERGIKAGSADPSAVRALVDAAAGDIIGQGARALLLACTELSLTYASEHPAWGVPTFDAAQLVAEHVIAAAGGRLRSLNLASSKSEGNRWRGHRS